jgi:prevent-host-death family protein
MRAGGSGSFLGVPRSIGGLVSRSQEHKEEPAIGVVNVRDLSRRTSKLVERVQRDGRAFLVTRLGEPVAALVPLDREALEESVLANAPRLHQEPPPSEDLAEASKEGASDVEQPAHSFAGKFLSLFGRSRP